MKLILLYTSGDNCSWSQDNIIPIEYSSAEDLICDFDDALEKCVEQNEHSFNFCSKEFELRYFWEQTFDKSRKKLCYEPFGKTLPEILTVDEWFERDAISKK